MKMCFTSFHRVQRDSDEELDLIIEETDRIEVENQLQLIEAFDNVATTLTETTSQALEDSEHPAEFTINPYGVTSVPVSYLSALMQYDEVNPQFFEETDSFAEPSVSYQEL